MDETALLAGPARERPVDGQGARSKRVIWPLALGFFERSRVVVAWCESREGFRNFRVDRIHSWTRLAESLPRPRSKLLREWRARENIPAQLPGK